MVMKRPFAAAIVVVGFMLVFQAYAKDEVVLTEPATFDAQKAKIEAEMGQGGEYGEISADRRAEVRRRLDSIGLALEAGGGTASRISPDRQVDVFNHQAAINQILTEAQADSRVVCSRERKTGSKFPTNRCVTVAEARREREAAREWSSTLNRGMEKKVP
ncbi:hypothetical protein [Luteimonas sp. A482]